MDSATPQSVFYVHGHVHTRTIIQDQTASQFEVHVNKFILTIPSSSCILVGPQFKCICYCPVPFPTLKLKLPLVLKKSLTLRLDDLYRFLLFWTLMTLASVMGPDSPPLGLTSAIKHCISSTWWPIYSSLASQSFSSNDCLTTLTSDSHSCGHSDIFLSSETVPL